MFQLNFKKTSSYRASLGWDYTGRWLKQPPARVKSSDQDSKLRRLNIRSTIPVYFNSPFVYVKFSPAAENALLNFFQKRLTKSSPGTSTRRDPPLKRQATATPLRTSAPVSSISPGTPTNLPSTTTTRFQTPLTAITRLPSFIHPGSERFPRSVAKRALILR
jgi:hypothetical protein